MPSGISIYGTATKYKLVQVKSYTKTITRKISAKTGRQFKTPHREKITIPAYRRTIETKPRQTRFSFYGTPEEIKQVRNKVLAEGRVPKRQFEDQIKATDFLQNPEDYSDFGTWVDIPEEDET